MIEFLEQFPKLCEEFSKITIEVSNDYKNVENVVIAGMGGSAIMADIIKDCFNSSIPVEISRKFELPTFANEKTLVIAVSYSGNTKETLSQLEEALDRKCKIFAITSGGKLEEICNRYELPMIKVKEGFPPRMALPMLLFPAVNLLLNLGFISRKDFVIRDGEVKELARNIAKQIKGKFPIIYSAYECLSRRFKSQLNENAKIIAKYEILPELNHNEIVGIKSLNRNFVILFIKTGFEREEIDKAMEYINEIAPCQCLRIEYRGSNIFDSVLNLIHYCDWISYFLAEELDVDPLDVTLIEELKNRIKEEHSFLEDKEQR